MRFHKMISPVALLLTATVLLNCPTIIGQVLQPIQSPQKSQLVPAPIESSTQNRPTGTQHAPTGTANGPTTSTPQKAPAPYKLSSRFHVQKGSQTGYLILKIELPQGSYIYSTTQKAPLRPSKITVAKSKQFRMDGEFTPDRPPTVIEKDPIFEQRLEKHTDVIQFFAIVKIAPTVDPETLTAALEFSGQVCDDRGFCIPIFGAKTNAKFAGYFERSAGKRTSSQTGPTIGSQPR